MVADVLDKLPHRPPFRFVTEVLSIVPGQCGTGVWQVSGAEDFFRGHFPGEPVVPGVLLAEALAQLAGIVGFSDGGDGTVRSARLAQVNLKFQSAVIPPAAIMLEAFLTREMSGLFLFEVKASVAGAAVAHGSLILASAAADHRGRVTP